LCVVVVVVVRAGEKEEEGGAANTEGLKNTKKKMGKYLPRRY